MWNAKTEEEKYNVWSWFVESTDKFIHYPEFCNFMELLDKEMGV